MPTQPSHCPLKPVPSTCIKKFSGGAMQSRMPAAAAGMHQLSLSWNPTELSLGTEKVHPSCSQNVDALLFPTATTICCDSDAEHSFPQRKATRSRHFHASGVPRHCDLSPCEHLATTHPCYTLESIFAHSTSDVLHFSNNRTLCGSPEHS